MLIKEKSNDQNRIRVTFVYPTSSDDRSVFLVGEFNSWNERSLPMLRTSNRTWEITIELDKHREYEFRYLVNNEYWCNDWCADSYRANPYGSDNSVVSTKKPEDLL